MEPAPPAVRRRAVVVGAGPAGLATARELVRRGVETVVLERDRIGSTWAAAYGHLRLHTRRGEAALPGLAYPRGTSTFPRADEVLAYLRAYAERFELDVREGVEVVAATPAGGGTPAEGGAPAEGAPPAAGSTPAAGGWRLATSAGTWRADALVWAAGIWGAPWAPDLPGRARFPGEVLHVRDYRGPEPFRGRRLLVVGAGNSGKDVAVAAVGVAAEVTLAVRGGVVVVPYPNALSQRSGALWRRLPPRWADAALRRLRRPYPELGLPWPDRPLTEVVPVVGLELVDAVRAGRIAVRPEVVGFGAGGVRFAGWAGAPTPFDVVVLATGFRPATAPIAEHLDAAGAPTAPGLVVVGDRYPTLETWLQQLRREAPAAARAVRASWGP
jgi:putative flavoprotein involved in K+ transport